MDKKIYMWLLFFGDGSHATAKGAEIEDACQTIGKTRADVAISRANFLRAIPVKYLSDTVPMSEEVKDHLRKVNKEYKTLRRTNK